MMLHHKKIILAVTGSIAAYKTPELVRQLVKTGAGVRVIATESALDFVSKLALATVSKHPVAASVHNGAEWTNHVEYGLWADAMLIAPCSANTLAGLAAGLCRTMVEAVYLSARCPVFVAPAMDEDMWLHPATQRNVAMLQSFGNRIIPVGHGELASGLVGPGRMAEVEDLVSFLDGHFQASKVLRGKKVLITAGPTYEKLDPVRFLGNFSSGKMGIALAEAFAGAGAAVSLVLGPSALRPRHESISVTNVTSAQEMHDAAVTAFADVDIAVMAAAVADYRPTQIAAEKIKKTGGALTLELERTPDILAAIGAAKTARQVVVGFALETRDELHYAQGKLLTKKADLIVMNSLRDEGAGFRTDTNKITLVTSDGAAEHPLMSKTDAAQVILQKAIELYHAKNPA